MLSPDDRRIVRRARRLQRYLTQPFQVVANHTGMAGVSVPLPEHAELITVLEPGLLRWRARSHPGWTHGACIGGLLRCMRERGRTEIRVVSSRILHGDDPGALMARLDDLLHRERALRVSTRESTLQLDVALTRRLQELARGRR